MSRPPPTQAQQAVLEAIARFADGASTEQIQESLAAPPHRRTLQRWLNDLMAQARVYRQGQGRSVKYRLGEAAKPGTTAQGASLLPLSPQAKEVEALVRQPLALRQPVGYRRAFLDGYRPNETWYLPQDVRDDLLAQGQAVATSEPAGTYARKIANRLLIDLSWNSSRLEGNTYSLLETEPTASGRLRSIAVGIGQTTFLPLEGPQRIAECFDQILDTAAAIRDPFEQAFFAMVHLPYLQPFEDVNKRVSRLAANIPLIQRNLCPLSFVDVEQAAYISAMLGVYELNRVELLRDVFVWAYKRSCARYSAVRQSLGEPDPFRLQYRQQITQAVTEVVREALGKLQAVSAVRRFAQAQIKPQDRERFIEVVETQLLSLHEGSIARYRLRPSEFQVWQAHWK